MEYALLALALAKKTARLPVAVILVLSAAEIFTPADLCWLTAVVFAIWLLSDGIMYLAKMENERADRAYKNSPAARKKRDEQHARFCFVLQTLPHVTRKGPLHQWDERLGEYCDVVGLNRGKINWNQSPELIAFDIARQARSSGYLEKLCKVVRHVKSMQDDEQEATSVATPEATPGATQSSSG